jgi:hypothetical protein
VAGPIRARRNIDVSSCLISLHGAAANLRTDGGTEFVSQTILCWLT